jgi:hypothetical protein
MSISDDFAYWLGIHGKADILPSQSIAISNVMERANEADLISVLYYGTDDLALKALKELKLRFEDELNALEFLSQNQSRNNEQEMQNARDWD